MTAKTRLLAYIYIVLCGGCLAVGIALCIGLILSSGDPRSGPALAMIGGFFVSASVVYFVPGLVGGVGLLRGRPWARVLIIVLSILGIFAFPIGTVLGVFSLWVLLGSESKQFAAPTPAAPSDNVFRKPSLWRIDTKRLPGVIVLVAGIGAGFVIMIGTGYRVTGNAGSPISNLLYFTAIGVFTLAIAMLGWWIWRTTIGATPPAERAAQRSAQRQFEENRQRAATERREQLDRLSADPIRRTYAERIQRGETWSDDQIEYDLDSSRLATCEHLAPIEREIRSAGIGVRMIEPFKISARCQVDIETFRARFSPPPFVEYAEPQPSMLSFDDALPARIACAEHSSSIDVVHPIDATSETPVFPSQTGVRFSDAPTRTEPPKDRYTQLRSEILTLARRIDLPSQMLPTHQHSVQTGLPHIEIHGDTYSYVHEDRGIEFDRFTTASMDELLYRVFRDITCSMAATPASRARQPGEDYRREAFRQQLELLRQLNPAWVSRCAAEHEATLATHPFVDRA